MVEHKTKPGAAPEDAPIREADEMLVAMGALDQARAVRALVVARDEAREEAEMYRLANCDMADASDRHAFELHEAVVARDTAEREAKRLREVIAAFNAAVEECNYPVQYLAVEIAP